MMSAASPGRMPVPGLAERVLAGQQRVARRRAGRGGRVRVGEAQAGFGEAVDVRRLHRLAP